MLPVSLVYLLVIRWFHRTLKQLWKLMDRQEVAVRRLSGQRPSLLVERIWYLRHLVSHVLPSAAKRLPFTFLRFRE